MDSIYDNPNYFNLRSNITFKQSRILVQLLDMEFVVSQAPHSFVIAPPVRQGFHPKKTHEEYEKQIQEDTLAANENFKENLSASHKLDRRVELRGHLFDEIQTICPDFCKFMDKKIPKQDYDIYFENKRALKKAIIPPEEYKSSYTEFLATCKSNLLNLTNSQKFIHACNIEDAFVVSELDNFFKVLADLPKEQRRHFYKKTIPYSSEETISLVDLAEKVKKERLERLEKHKGMSELKKQSKYKQSLESDFDEEK